MNDLVSAEWLFENRNNTKLIILDATIGSVGSGDSDSDSLCIPDSLFFDLKNDFCKPNFPFPNTFPSAELFQKSCRSLGINTDSEIVIYDKKGIYSSARAWYLFRKMGHQNVAVLNGGFPAWMKAKYPYSNIHAVSKQAGNFVATLEIDFLKSYEKVKENVAKKSFSIVDARSAGRFSGDSPEPREDLKSGHIPHSYSLPFTKVLSDGFMKDSMELKKVFRELNLQDMPLTFSCGSGITACIILLAYKQISDDRVFLFDGSWTEWAIKENLLKE